MPKSRDKGNAYELKIVQLFKELGWTGCVSSRSESKRTDDAGIDLCYTAPFQVQCKAWETTPPYHQTLANMPQSAKTVNLLFHKKNRKGSVVVLTEEDFVYLLQLLISSGQIQPNV